MPNIPANATNWLGPDRRWRSGVVLACIATTACIAPRAEAQTFAGLGIPAGDDASRAYCISRDGLVIGGEVDVSLETPRAVRWVNGAFTDDMGLTGSRSTTYALNGDGSVAAGGEDGLAFLWTLATGRIYLGVLNRGTTSAASSISDDGAVVVGYADSAGDDLAFRWTAATGMVSLGLLAGDTISAATGVSADGTVVVGNSFHSNIGTPHAFRWTAATGLVALGAVPGLTTSQAMAVSADGSVVVGQSGGVFRWTASGGMESLGALDGDSAYTHAVNSDGSVIVGAMTGTTGGRAFFWTRDLGVVDLQMYLISHGANLAGWTLSVALGVSGDGTIIVGAGHHNQTTEGWVVQLGPRCGSPDFNHDGDVGTDADIVDFFSCLGGSCCPTCGSADFNGDGDPGTDSDIESFFRVLAGGPC